jgi:hypothetical protein
MRSNVNRFLNAPLFPWLITLYPIVFLYSVNLSTLRHNGVLEVAVMALAIASVVLGLWYLAIRDAYKSGASTAVIALLILLYGHIYKGLYWSPFVLTPLMVGVGGMVGVVLIAMYLPIFSLAGNIKAD